MAEGDDYETLKAKYEQLVKDNAELQASFDQQEEDFKELEETLESSLDDETRRKEEFQQECLRVDVRLWQ